MAGVWVLACGAGVRPGVVPVALPCGRGLGPSTVAAWHRPGCGAPGASSGCLPF